MAIFNFEFGNKVTLGTLPDFLLDNWFLYIKKYIIKEYEKQTLTIFYFVNILFRYFTWDSKKELENWMTVTITAK